MPIVPPEHLEAQRVRILEAAQRCFTANGIHPTTMQDICREADLSAGAIYRYFKGKQEIIDEVFRRSLADNLRSVSTLAAGADSPGAFTRLLEHGFGQAQDPSLQNEIRFGVVAAGEAMRDASIAYAHARLYRELAAGMRPIAARAQESGLLASGVDPLMIIRLFVALFEGFRVQHLVDPSVSAKEFAQAAVSLMLRGGCCAEGGTKEGSTRRGKRSGRRRNGETSKAKVEGGTAKETGKARQETPNSKAGKDTEKNTEKDTEKDTKKNTEKKA